MGGTTRLGVVLETPVEQEEHDPKAGRATRGYSSRVSDTASQLRVSHVLGWAAFLACSWTWCIGMFLPVILLRDFGGASFWVFAVPNVVGAALMGVLLARPGASETFVARHGRACWLFSLVTLTFQWFFLFWMIVGLTGNASRFVGIPAIAVILLAGRLTARRTWWTRTFALVVYGASLVLGLLWLSGRPAEPIIIPRLPETDLVWLAPVILFGFAFCPYLDLTFHHARQKLPGRAGSVAFILGFGVLFFAAIMLTRAYAPGLLIQSSTAGTHVHPGLLALTLLAHVGIQLMYTVMVHKPWVDAEPSLAGPRTPANAAFLGLIFATAVAVISSRLPDYAGLSASEVVYRGFMSFYGLVFPAYVWLCVLGQASLTRRAVQVFVAAVIVAAPMYWMGFIERQTWWLAPGLGVVLLARFFIPRTNRSGNPGPTPASAT